MNRPEITFTITVNPIVYVYSCAERKAEEDRGSFCSGSAGNGEGVLPVR